MLCACKYLRTEDDDGREAPPAHVDLKLSTLNSLHALNEEHDTSTFAGHGMDEDRIVQVLKHPPCECKCRLPASVLTKACRSFWSLPKQSQDAFLWTLQSESGASRKTWKIEGPYGSM